MHKLISITAAVALVLFSRNRHLTAEKIHTLAKEKGCITSRAAIYNTLTLFVNKGIIRQLIVGQGNTYYISNTPSSKIREIYSAYNASLKANRMRQSANPTADTIAINKVV